MGTFLPALLCLTELSGSCFAENTSRLTSASLTFLPPTFIHSIHLDSPNLGIYPNFNIYLLKLQNVSVVIDKCICLDCQIYPPPLFTPFTSIPLAINPGIYPRLSFGSCNGTIWTGCRLHLHIWDWSWPFQKRANNSNIQVWYNTFELSAFLLWIWIKYFFEKTLIRPLILGIV